MRRSTFDLLRPLAGGIISAGLAAATPAFAQTAPAPAPAGAAEPSPNAMVNLIRLLVQQKVITAPAGDVLMAQAELEAATARSRMASSPTAPPPPEGAVRVPYVPQVVKDQIRDELRTEVLAQAKQEGWVAPNAVPKWVNRVRLYGDMRFRSQSNIYDDSNAPDFIDFNRFNELGPTDVNILTTGVGIPFLNTRQDRLNRFNIRARLGLEADITPGITVGARLATGNDNGPVSTSHLLGGGFAKKNIWLDLGYIRGQYDDYAEVTLGRMRNPFHTSEVFFDSDLNFDGVALSVNSAHWTGSKFKIIATGGAFPYEYAADGSPADSFVKSTGNIDKYIYGGQLGFAYSDNRLHARVSGGYFDFTNVRGSVSEPCLYFLGTECSTDTTRPAFLNKGNTLIYLRNIEPPTSGATNYEQPQFVGLGFDYNIVQAEADLGYDVTDKLRLTAGGAYLRNLAYDRAALCRRGATVIANFIGSNGYCGADSVRLGGNTAWSVETIIGTPVLQKAKQWSVGAAYRRIESDATIDALTDDNFHLGGTNTKGYVLTGSYMLFDNIRLQGRYLSANEIAGPPLGIDVLQIDITAGF